MSPRTTELQPLVAQPAEADVFDLDVTLLEMADPAGLVNVTDDGCGSTCGACVTGAA